MSHVLIVEDELLLRRIITMNLVQRGYSVGEADTVECAIDMLMAAREAGYPFDFIILETHLYERSGWDLLRLIRSPEAARTGLTAPPVLVMSALPVSRSRASEFTPVAVLIKPFPIEALLRQVERADSQASATA